MSSNYDNNFQTKYFSLVKRIKFFEFIWETNKEKKSDFFEMNGEYDDEEEKVFSKLEETGERAK